MVLYRPAILPMPVRHIQPKSLPPIMLTRKLTRRGRWRLFDRLSRRPRLVAVFSFRYDAHLVPDLIANIEPIVDAWIAYDDRGSSEVFSSELERHRRLI